MGIAATRGLHLWLSKISTSFLLQHPMFHPLSRWYGRLRLFAVTGMSGTQLSSHGGNEKEEEGGMSTTLTSPPPKQEGNGGAEEEGLTQFSYCFVEKPFLFLTQTDPLIIFEKSKQKSNLTSVTEQQSPRQGGITLHYIFVTTTM